MKHALFTLLLATLCATTSFGQTIKSLGYNTTNGQVVANTGTNVLTFTNINGIQVNNLTVGETSLRANFYVEDDGLSISVYRTNAETYIGNLGFTDNSVRLAVPVSFNNTTNAAATRTNVGLGLQALTNTSNVTAMRALAGSTNTNEPYNGIIQYADGPDGDTYEMTVSNGIILKIEMQ
jgi:hypothetical protein